MPQASRHRRVVTALALNVQDRRNRARALLETRQRKAALLALDAPNVAHRLHLMQPPERIMDSCSAVEAAPKTPEPTTEVEDSALQQRRGPVSYEQWLEEGCPADFWRPLLEEELYRPLEAEQLYLATKYSLAAKGGQSTKRSTHSMGARSGLRE
ncbi:hypothetical protein DQ04_04481000 [Trypanosoma grayi]|uniref:hypothetical protein n=1 Tax=Trypanosoma grayi TaxID=71804 RepID=UPI0004F482A7|nr:hypothetical protein DQ04_04481000 [Trypanosoma grayi]KEG09890.1 hypothetical protein DQ04_04481000 [Trypanosoma grayi]